LVAEDILLQLECVAVRLYDPGSGEPVEATRGDASTCSEWLRGHLSERRPLSCTEIISGGGGGSGSWRGVVIPVGVDAAGGVVAAVSDRTEFPSEVDQLLFTLLPIKLRQPFRTRASYTSASGPKSSFARSSG
jgi:hypothetical protein